MPPVAAIVIGLGIAAAAGPVGVGVFGSMMLFQTMVFGGLSMVLGGISKALKGTPKSNYSRTSTVRQAVYDGRVIYGRVRIGGVLTYVETSGSDNAYLHLVYTLCSHELASIDAMYFENEIVSLDGAGNAIGNYAGLVHVEKNLGTYDQAVFPGLLASSYLWRENHRQRGRAGVYVKLKWDQKKFPSGIPNIAFDVTGRPVRMPRGFDNIGYSNNSALCLADYLMDTDFGLGAQRKIPVNASQIAYSGVTIYNLAHVTDDDYAAPAFSIVGAAPGSWLGIDFGAAPREVSEVRVYTDGTADGQGRLQYSDDSTAWTNATMNLKPTLGRVGVPNKYRVPFFGPHRYWRFLVDTAATQGTITELELLEPALDIDGLASAAVICDEPITLRAGGTENRYCTDGAFDLTEAPVDVVTAMAGAMGGFCTYVGGQFALFPGFWRDPDDSLSFDEGDLAGPLKVISRRSKRDIYNSVRGTFISPGDNWQATNFPVVSDLARLEEDLGERLYLDANLPFTISSSRAQRISRIALNRSRKQISVQARFKLTAYRFQPCDVIKLTNARFGWTDKLFEVESMQFAAESSDSAEGAVLVVDATLRETDSTIYDWNPATDELPQTGVLPAAFPTHGPCAAPTGLVLNPAEIIRATDGIRTNIIAVSWIAPNDQYVQSGGHILVLFKKHTDTGWTVLATVDGDQTSAVIPNLLDATSYDVMIYAVNLYGVKSSGIAGTVTTTSTKTPIDGLADGVYIKGVGTVQGLQLQNANFEASDTILPPPGWIDTLGVSSYLRTGQQSGARSLQLTADNAGMPVWGVPGAQTASVMHYSCKPGDRFVVSGYAKGEAAATQVLIGLDFVGPSGWIGNSDGPYFGFGLDWEYRDHACVAPAGVVYFTVYCLVMGPVGTHAWFDNVAVTKVLNLDSEVADGSAYIRSTQYSSAIDIDNANFEASSVLPPPGWTNMRPNVGVTSNLAYETGSQHAGTRSLKVTSTSGYGGAYSVKRWKVAPGEVYKIAGWVKSDGANAAGLAIDAYDANGNFVAGLMIPNTTSTSWTYLSQNGAVPAGAVSIGITLVVYSAGTGTCWFDDIFATRVSSLDDEINDGAIYAKPTYAQTYGGTRAYNALDSSNVLVASGADFARSYSNKGVLATVNNLDGVPDGGSYYRTEWWQRDGGGRGYYGLDTSNMVVAGGIDFNRAYTNKNTDYIAEGGNKYAGEHGADVTGSHTANDTNNVYGSGSWAVGPGAVRGYYAIDTSNIIVAGGIDFSRGYSNKNLDNIGDGTRAAWGSGSQRDNAVDSSGNLKLKNVNDAVGTTNGPAYASVTYTVIAEMTQTRTFKGNKVLLVFSISGYFPSGGVTCAFAFFKDGLQLSQDYGAAGTTYIPLSLSFIDSPSAAIHTYDVRVKTSSTSGAFTAAGTARRFQIVELG